MIIERIIKALEEQNIYSFEIIYSYDLVSGMTSLSMFLLMRPESLLLAGLAKSLVLKKCFCFYQEICFSFFTIEACRFQRDVNSIYFTYKIKLESLKLPRSVFSRLEIFMVLMNFSWYLLNGIFSLCCRGKWEWYYSSLSGRSPNTEQYVIKLKSLK